MIQINTCTPEDIKRLPGVGPATAQKIIEARPIKDMAQLEELIPPSAWLKVQEAGVEFGFGEDAPLDVGGTQKRWEEAITRVAMPPIILQEQTPMTLRRVMPGQSLRRGASYLCPWNMRWGAAGEAYLPVDVPVQGEIEAWFKGHDMAIQFAHYGASVRVRTKNKGLVPLVLFEIIEEKRDDSEAESATAGAGQGDA